MSADILIDDGVALTNGSVDRDDSFIGTTFTFSNFDNTGVLGWRWTIVDKPAGSSAALTTPTLATTQITPDIEGTYVVRLDTYLDAGATDLDSSDVQLVGVRYATPRDWLIPGAGQTIQLDSARGWASQVNEILRDARDVFASANSQRITGAVQITTATPANIFTFATTSEELYRITVQVTMKQSTTVNAYSATLTASFKNDGGTLTQIGLDSVDAHDGAAGAYSVLTNINGTTIEIQVTQTGTDTVECDARGEIVWSD